MEKLARKGTGPVPFFDGFRLHAAGRRLNAVELIVQRPIRILPREHGRTEATDAFQLLDHRVGWPRGGRPGLFVEQYRGPSRSDADASGGAYG
jgi:hypothetical protein